MSENIKFPTQLRWSKISNKQSDYSWWSKWSQRHDIKRGCHCVIAQSIILSNFCHASTRHALMRLTAGYLPKNDVMNACTIHQLLWYAADMIVIDWGCWTAITVEQIHSLSRQQSSCFLCTVCGSTVLLEYETSTGDLHDGKKHMLSHENIAIVRSI